MDSLDNDDTSRLLRDIIELCTVSKRISSQFQTPTVSRSTLIRLIRALNYALQRPDAKYELLNLDRGWLLQELRRYAFGKSPNLREAAIRAVVIVDPVIAVDWIVDLLKDPHEPMRWFLCAILGDIGDERSVLTLMRIAQEDPKTSVRLAAISALGSTGDLRALPTLQYAVTFDSGIEDGRPVAYYAAAAIRAIQKRHSESH